MINSILPFNFKFSHFGQISYLKKYWGLLVTKMLFKNTKGLQNGPPMSFIKALSSFLSQAIFLGENFHRLGNQKKNLSVWTMRRIYVEKLHKSGQNLRNFIFLKLPYLDNRFWQQVGCQNIIGFLIFSTFPLFLVAKFG
jgi:hypothetical protein